MELNNTTYQIHVFGDSHSRIYSSPYLSNYICNVYYVGPITMHRVGRDKLTLDDLKELSQKNYKEYLPKCKPEYKHMKYPDDDEIKNNDMVIFVFGEIDIRNHYAKQIEKGRNHTEIINSLVNNYIETVLLNKSKYNNVKFCIQSVPPAVDIKNLNEELKDYPINGHLNQRIRATIEINKLLKEKCKLHNLLYLDTTTYYQNDETIFPVNGLCKKAELYELDTRIKDKNVHVSIEHPEGIEHVFKMNDIPINLKYYKYNKKCKYPVSLNKFQRDTVIRLRIIHLIVMVLLGISLFLPNKYILVTLTIWSMVILFNIAMSIHINGSIDCSFNILEFRLSNCNNYNILDELGIPRYMQNIVPVIYVVAFSVILFRTYYYFNNKNLFNFKLNLKFLKQF